MDRIKATSDDHNDFTFLITDGILGYVGTRTSPLSRVLVFELDSLEWHREYMQSIESASAMAADSHCDWLYATTKTDAFKMQMLNNPCNGTDKNATVTVEDLMIKYNLSYEEAQTLFNAADANGDGILTEQELAILEGNSQFAQIVQNLKVSQKEKGSSDTSCRVGSLPCWAFALIIVLLALCYSCCIFCVVFCRLRREKKLKRQHREVRHKTGARMVDEDIMEDERATKYGLDAERYEFFEEEYARQTAIGDAQYEYAYETQPMSAEHVTVTEHRTTTTVTTTTGSDGVTATETVTAHSQHPVEYSTKGHKEAKRRKKELHAQINRVRDEWTATHGFKPSNSDLQNDAEVGPIYSEYIEAKTRLQMYEQLRADKKHDEMNDSAVPSE